MEPWIPITLTAALCQTWRTALQQRLRGLLSVNGAGFVRYLYALPTGAALLFGGYWITGVPMPAPHSRFFLECAAGGFLQIVGTNLLIMSFGFRNFAVGTAYSKTEALQSAIAAWIVLGEALTRIEWVGIGIGVVGVLVLSLGGRGLRGMEILRATVQPAALCGMGTGLCFSFTAIFIKEANRSLGGGHPVLQALFTLVVTNTLQTLMQGAWIAWREPQQFRAVFQAWQGAALVGTLSAFGSACWFSAFALAPVALVRSVGQTEMALTLAFSRFYLKEQIRRADVAGLLLIVAGVTLIVATR